MPVRTVTPIRQFGWASPGPIGGYYDDASLSIPGPWAVDDWLVVFFGASVPGGEPGGYGTPGIGLANPDINGGVSVAGTPLPAQRWYRTSGIPGQPVVFTGYTGISVRTVQNSATPFTIYINPGGRRGPVWFYAMVFNNPSFGFWFSAVGLLPNDVSGSPVVGPAYGTGDGSPLLTQPFTVPSTTYVLTTYIAATQFGTAGIGTPTTSTSRLFGGTANVKLLTGGWYQDMGPDPGHGTLTPMSYGLWEAIPSSPNGSFPSHSMGGGLSGSPFVTMAVSVLTYDSGLPDAPPPPPPPPPPDPPPSVDPPPAPPPPPDDPGGGVDVIVTVDPSIVFTYPPTGQPTGSGEPVEFEARGRYRSCIVRVIYPLRPDLGWELVFDGQAFGPDYQGPLNRRTTLSSALTGYAFSVLRDNGWPSPPHFTVWGTTVAGVEVP